MASLNIELIVHGVPHGHKIWNAREDEKRYIATFYGPTYEVDEQMIVERRGADMYYTFVRGRNVVSEDNRPGSFLALTLRMNAYYADIRNVYGILRAAYQKTIVGTGVTETGGAAKYRISDFAQVDAKLREAKQSVVDYIGRFSQQSDLCDLSAIRPGAGGAATRLNLLDCSAQAAEAVLKAGGRLIVSPCFPTTEMQRVLDQKHKELAAAQQQAQLQVAQVQQQASQSESRMKTRIEALEKEQASLRRQMEEAKAQAKSRHEQELRECKSRVAQLEGMLSKVAEDISGFTQPKGNGAARTARTGQHGPHGRLGGNQPRGYTPPATGTTVTGGSDTQEKGWFSTFTDFLTKGLPILLLFAVLGMGCFMIHAQNRTARALDALMARTDSLCADSLSAGAAAEAELEAEQDAEQEATQEAEQEATPEETQEATPSEEKAQEQSKQSLKTSN